MAIAKRTIFRVNTIEHGVIKANLESIEMCARRQTSKGRGLLASISHTP
jgi:hypothetical protein